MKRDVEKDNWKDGRGSKMNQDTRNVRDSKRNGMRDESDGQRLEPVPLLVSSRCHFHYFICACLV